MQIMINLYMVIKLEIVNNDKFLIAYEIPELIRKLHKKLLAGLWQKSHVSNIMEWQKCHFRAWECFGPKKHDSWLYLTLGSSDATFLC